MPSLKRMTNKDLARWCSLGKGQVCLAGPDGSCASGLITLNWQYSAQTEDTDVAQRVYIREWGSRRWNEPMIDTTTKELNDGTTN